MKILHVIDSGGLYGAEQVILQLCEGILKKGHHTALLSIGSRSEGEKQLEVEAEKKGIPVTKMRFGKGLNVNGALKILRKARDLNIDIIHSHGYKPNILLGIIPGFWRKVPVVSTLHGWTSHKKFSKLWLYRIFDILALKNINAVVSVTEEINSMKLLKSVGIKPVIINNGLPELEFDMNGFAQVFPEVASTCKNSFKILSIGRLSSEKGYDILIQAVAQLTKKKYEICLVIAGDGPQKEKLQTLIKDLKLENNVYLIGYYPQFYQFTPFFDVFVLSSFTEGLPITLLEVMQCGIPIVASSVGEIPRVLQFGKYGKLTEPGNSIELAEALSAVYNSRIKSGSASDKTRDFVLQNFGLSAMTNQYLSLYRQLSEA